MNSKEFVKNKIRSVNTIFICNFSEFDKELENIKELNEALRRYIRYCFNYKKEETVFGRKFSVLYGSQTSEDDINGPIIVLPISDEFTLDTLDKSFKPKDNHHKNTHLQKKGLELLIEKIWRFFDISIEDITRRSDVEYYKTLKKRLPVFLIFSFITEEDFIEKYGIYCLNSPFFYVINYCKNFDLSEMFGKKDLREENEKKN